MTAFLAKHGLGLGLGLGFGLGLGVRLGACILLRRWITPLDPNHCRREASRDDVEAVEDGKLLANEPEASAGVPSSRNSRSLAELEEALRHMTRLRDAERAGRTAAEKQLRQRAQVHQAEYGFVMHPIATVASPFPDRRGTPRQGTVAPAAEGVVMLEPHVPGATLEGLEGFSHVWILFVFHENTNFHLSSPLHQRGSKSDKAEAATEAQQEDGSVGGSQAVMSCPAKVVPPRLGKKVGVFSTRSPHRPNPIGLTVCRIVRVDSRARSLTLSGVDLVDGTPVLDLKPYIPYDLAPELQVPGWVLPEGLEHLPASQMTQHHMTTGAVVNFTDDALENISQIFAARRSRSTKTGGFGSPILRHYGDRQGAFIDCVRQVISQDPRSVHHGRRTAFHRQTLSEAPIIDGAKKIATKPGTRECSGSHTGRRTATEMHGRGGRVPSAVSDFSVVIDGVTLHFRASEQGDCMTVTSASLSS